MLSHSFVNQFPLHFGITIDAHLLLRRTGPFWRGEIIAYQQSHAQHIVVCVCVWGGGALSGEAIICMAAAGSYSQRPNSWNP